MAEWLQDVSIGEWFEGKDQPFEIVGIDTDTEVVLVQNFDGSLEELDFDHWLALEARPCAPPEDYSGALDLTADDYDPHASERSGHGPIDNPLNQLDLDSRFD